MEYCNDMNDKNIDLNYNIRSYDIYFPIAWSRLKSRTYFQTRQKKQYYRTLKLFYH